MFLENSTHVILDKKRGKVEGVICISFPDQRSEFITYTLLCAKYVIKIFQKKNMKNSENYKKVKWRSNPPNSKMFLALLIQIKKNFFPKKGTFNYASNPWMLYLSKIGPENISDHFLAPIIFKSMKFVGYCPSVIKSLGLHFVSIDYPWNRGSPIKKFESRFHVGLSFHIRCYVSIYPGEDLGSMSNNKILFSNFFISPEIGSLRQFKGCLLLDPSITATLTRQRRAAANLKLWPLLIKQKCTLITSLSLWNILINADVCITIEKLLNFNWLLHPNCCLHSYVIDLDIITLEVFTEMWRGIYFTPQTDEDVKQLLFQ